VPYLFSGGRILAFALQGEELRVLSSFLPSKIP
jgi:hypothetical protein